MLAEAFANALFTVFLAGRFVNERDDHLGRVIVLTYVKVINFGRGMADTHLLIGKTSMTILVG